MTDKTNTKVLAIALVITLALYGAYAAISGGLKIQYAKAYAAGALNAREAFMSSLMQTVKSCPKGLGLNVSKIGTSTEDALNGGCLQ